MPCTCEESVCSTCGWCSWCDDAPGETEVCPPCSNEWHRRMERIEEIRGY